jgi:hypothetical protein
MAKVWLLEYSFTALHQCSHWWSFGCCSVVQILAAEHMPGDWNWRWCRSVSLFSGPEFAWLGRFLLEWSFADVVCAGCILGADTKLGHGCTGAGGAVADAPAVAGACRTGALLARVSGVVLALDVLGRSVGIACRCFLRWTGSWAVVVAGLVLGLGSAVVWEAVGVGHFAVFGSVAAAFVGDAAPAFVVGGGAGRRVSPVGVDPGMADS